MPAALALSRIAERTLGEVLGSADKARRLALSLFFRAALGIERIFPFETLDDLGFAILSGGKRVLSRSRLGGLVRAVKTIAVKKFARATEPLGALRDKVVTLSLDEHAIARFTRKFRIPALSRSDNGITQVGPCAPYRTLSHPSPDHLPNALDCFAASHFSA